MGTTISYPIYILLKYSVSIINLSVNTVEHTEPDLIAVTMMLVQGQTQKRTQRLGKYTQKGRSTLV
jgi:hypothetical protein